MIYRLIIATLILIYIAILNTNRRLAPIMHIAVIVSITALTVLIPIENKEFAIEDLGYLSIGVGIGLCMVLIIVAQSSIVVTLSLVVIMVSVISYTISGFSDLTIQLSSLWLYITSLLAIKHLFIAKQNNEK